ncbi:SURF1 family protein [Nakamurella deserti]|uniref:SURF1 family cytochrome oxidase biogenesis protein n=1 Tax=Nakamurella deserti TaxID=2164074 RepID=UPI000DBE522F|nr:SURF1 family cytochrome oxidase biogenesis protein [Nakamurella deserti]
MTLTARPTPPAPAPRRAGIRAILTPGWLAVVALATVFAGACWFVLAPWQYHRHQEREALNDQIETALAAPPAPVQDLLVSGAEPPASSEFRLVTATGSFVPDEQVYVRLRQQNGSSASEVVLPFKLTDGTRVLIDRGYVSNDDLKAGDLPAPVPSGEITVTGRVSADQPDPSNRPRQEVDGRIDVYGIDSAVLLGDEPGARLGFVQLVDGTPGVLNEIGVPDRDGGPFLSYALQWAVFGAVALLAAGFFAYREVTDPPGDDPETTGAASPGPPTDPTADPADAADVAAVPGSAAGPPGRAPAAPGTVGTGKPRKPRFDKSQLYD